MENPSAAALSEIPPTSARAVTNFANFQFKTIGQPPDLLKRMSAADADIPAYENTESGSMSPEPDLVHELLPSEGYEESPGGLKQLSLRERLALQEEDNVDDSSNTISTTRPDNVIDWNAGRGQPSGRLHTQTSAIEQRPNTSSTASTSYQQRKTNGDTAVAPSLDRTQSPSSMEVDDNLRPNSDHSLSSQRHQSATRISSEIPLNVPQTSILPTFAALQDLKARLVASLAKLNPITTQDALLIADSAKDSCAEVHTSANRAYELSCKALSAAEESMSAAKECLTLAETVQRKTDEVLNAVTDVGDKGQKASWNDALQTLSSGLHELDRWGMEMEIQYTRELDHMHAGQRSQVTSTQYPLSPSSNNSSSMTTSSLPPVITGSTSAPMLLSVEHEADAAAEAWNQIREQGAERRRLAEEDLRKHRENEERLQREKDEADAAHAAAIAERIEAEEKEKERQKKEDEEAELRRQELARKQAEAARLRQASEERALKNAEANEKARLHTQREEQQRQKQKEAQRRLEAERPVPADSVQAETQLQQQLQEREIRRQEIANQKQRANADNAKKIQSDRAKLKQPLQASVTKLSAPLSQNAALPVTPSKSHHVQLLSQKNDVAIARTPSSDILNRGKSLENHTSRVNTSASCLLNGIVASATLSSAAASHSGLLDFSTRSLHLPADATPVGVRGNYIPTSMPLMHPALSVSVAGEGVVSGAQHKGDGKPARQLPTDQKLSSIERTSKAPSASLGAWPSIQTASVHKSGESPDNVTLIPCSQISSTSSVSHKANSGIKVEPEDDKLLTADYAQTASVSSQLSASSKVNARSEAVLPKNQFGNESLNDIPLLSLPFPATRQISSHETRLPAEKPMEGSEKQNLRSAKGHGKKTSTGHGLQGVQASKHAAVPTTNASQSSNGSQTAKNVNPGGYSQTNGLNVASLPPRPQTFLDYRGRTPGHNIMESSSGDLSSRMGPDTAATDDWTKTISSDEAMHADQRRSQARSPPRQNGRIDDHYSPSPTAVSRGKQRGRQPPRGDHYSPPRSPPHRLQSPIPNYPSQSKQPMIPSRSHSRDSDYIRGLTPGHEVYEHQPLPAKRKRSHLVDQTNGPPNRRARYDSQFLYDAESSRNDVHNWSNVADYSRSPTPDMPRSTPLHMRIEDNDRRPQHQAPNHRNNQGINKQRTDFHHNRLPLSQGSPREPRYESNNSMRQNPRHSNDLRQPLINRFGEPAPLSQSNYHAPSGRGSRGRGRGGAHHPVGNRHTKATLMDRLD